MRRRAGIACLGSLALVAAALATATGGARNAASPAPAPGDPVVAGGPEGAYAVAVPGMHGSPAISGDSVAFAVEDAARERLFSIGAASADGGWRTLYTAPGRRPGSAWPLAASEASVAFVRHFPRPVQSCVVDGECTPSPDEVIGGPPGGPLTRVFSATERLGPIGSCRRRIAQLEDLDAGGVSGERIAYARRVRCMAPRRPGRDQVVVRDLRTGAVRVVHRGAARRVQLAGDYLAFERVKRGGESTVVVLDLRSERVAHRARAGDWYSLGSDGILAMATFGSCCIPTGKLTWYSPVRPHRHRLPYRVSGFSASPIAYADGRIAYVSRYDALGASLSVTDLRGGTGIHARFDAPEQLAAFDFDGARLAFAHTRYRPDEGAGDDGLPTICVDDRLLVQASATVIEVHSVADPSRLPAPQLPLAAPYRSEAADRPECPYRD